MPGSVPVGGELSGRVGDGTESADGDLSHHDCPQGGLPSLHEEESWQKGWKGGGWRGAGADTTASKALSQGGSLAPPAAPP